MQGMRVSSRHLKSKGRLRIGLLDRATHRNQIHIRLQPAIHRLDKGRPRRRIDHAHVIMRQSLCVRSQRLWKEGFVRIDLRRRHSDFGLPHSRLFPYPQRRLLTVRESQKPRRIQGRSARILRLRFARRSPHGQK